MDSNLGNSDSAKMLRLMEDNQLNLYSYYDLGMERPNMLLEYIN